jgi:hypothetical protein
MNALHTSQIRTRLRQVNMEYSMLLRDRTGEGRFVRMNELKTERKALMAMMGVAGIASAAPVVARQPLPGVPMLHVVE